MRKAQWTITEDLITDPSEETPTVGLVGPRTATCSAGQIISHPAAVSFELLDDDGGVYARGKMIPGNDPESEFGPLYDFGEPNWGCTAIKVNGKII